jgi:hypothetical protein
MSEQAERATRALFADDDTAAEKQVKLATALQEKPLLVAAAMQDDKGLVTSKSIESFIKTHELDIAKIEKGKVSSETKNMIPPEMSGKLDQMAKERKWQTVDNIDVKTDTRHFDTMVMKQLLADKLPQAIVAGEQEWTTDIKKQGRNTAQKHYTAGHLDLSKLPPDNKLTSRMEDLPPPKNPPTMLVSKPHFKPFDSQEPEPQPKPQQPPTQLSSKQPSQDPEESRNPGLPPSSNPPKVPEGARSYYLNHATGKVVESATPFPKEPAAGGASLPRETTPKEAVPMAIIGDRNSADRVESSRVMSSSERGAPESGAGLLAKGMISGGMEAAAARAQAVGAQGQSGQRQV